MPDLIVQGVTKEFPTRDEPLVVLRGCDLAMKSGERLAILGPSGSGKSTLLQILGTLEPPTSGEVKLNGENPFLLDEPKLADFRNRQIGFVFQDHYLLPQCSVVENVFIPQLAQGGVSKEVEEYGLGLLQRVGLSNRLNHFPAELSGGERQRVALVRALLLRPSLLLADEPTGNLDRSTAAIVAKILLELASDTGTMLIVVTHSWQLARLLDRQLELDQGRLVPWTQDQG